MITLIIKAQDPMLARQAAGNHKVHIENIYQRAPNEVRAETSETNIIKVQQWFAEPWPEKGAFPVGTLLFFRNGGN